jgi:serine phosphatase RsbU (regulator of sigma subunit)
MLRFSDFSHLPQVDELVRQLVAETSGMILITGLDSRPKIDGSYHFLPSGRATIFRIIVSEMLDARPKANCIVVSEDRDVLHVARRFKSRLEHVLVKPPLDYSEAIRNAAGRRPGLLVLDRLARDNLPAMLAAANDGLSVICQCDTLFHAQAIGRYLGDMGATPDELTGLKWVLSVQRLPVLCPICKQPAEVTADHMAQLQALSHRYPALSFLHAPTDGGVFYTEVGCPACRNTGRQGDVAVFDFYRPTMQGSARGIETSDLPMAAYVWMLAQQGQLALSDVLNFESEQLRRTNALLMASEQFSAETSGALERKIAELETANRLLEQRTRELVSLEAIGQSLTTWSDLQELGAHIVSSAVELSRADRGILYYVRSQDWAQILASRGWPGAQVGYGLARTAVYHNLDKGDLSSYLATPPGVDAPADNPPVRSGLAVPLIAHGIPAGLMIVQSTRRAKFSPGEVALLETLAGHAAIAMQRAGFIEQLQAQIDALEHAQTELARRERLEREMELAREVQMSMLPQSFPNVPGLAFAARYAPARHVGGDFYDVIRLGDDLVGVVIADVSDKGIPAALYMTLVRVLIMAGAAQNASPRSVLEEVNHLLVENFQQNMFVTVFYGVIDLRQRTLTYTRAGHDMPFLIRDGQIEILRGVGMALGLFETGFFQLSEESLDLKPGDKLILYTDGLSDVLNPKGTMLGQEGLITFLMNHSHKSVDRLCSDLFDDLSAYQQNAPQFDDMAMLAVMIAE